MIRAQPNHHRQRRVLLLIALITVHLLLGSVDTATTGEASNASQPTKNNNLTNHNTLYTCGVCSLTPESLKAQPAVRGFLILTQSRLKATAPHAQFHTLDRVTYRSNPIAAISKAINDNRIAHVVGFSDLSILMPTARKFPNVTFQMVYTELVTDFNIPPNVQIAHSGLEMSGYLAGSTAGMVATAFPPEQRRVALLLSRFDVSQIVTAHGFFDGIKDRCPECIVDMHTAANTDNEVRLAMARKLVGDGAVVLTGFGAANPAVFNVSEEVYTFSLLSNEFANPATFASSPTELRSYQQLGGSSTNLFSGILDAFDDLLKGGSLMPGWLQLNTNSLLYWPCAVSCDYVPKLNRATSLTTGIRKMMQSGQIFFSFSTQTGQKLVSPTQRALAMKERFSFKHRSPQMAFVKPIGFVLGSRLVVLDPFAPSPTLAVATEDHNNGTSAAAAAVSLNNKSFPSAAINYVFSPELQTMMPTAIPQSQARPEPRTLAALGSNLNKSFVVLYGGVRAVAPAADGTTGSSSSSRILEDLWVGEFSCSTCGDLQWTRIEYGSVPGKVTPGRRYGAAIAPHGTDTNVVYLQGGRLPTGRDHDLFKLTFSATVRNEQRSWGVDIVRVGADPHGTRVFHAMALYRGSLPFLEGIRGTSALTTSNDDVSSISNSEEDGAETSDTKWYLIMLGGDLVDSDRPTVPTQRLTIYEPSRDEWVSMDLQQKAGVSGMFYRSNDMKTKATSGRSTLSNLGDNITTASVAPGDATRARMSPLPSILQVDSDSMTVDFQAPAASNLLVIGTKLVYSSVKHDTVPAVWIQRYSRGDAADGVDGESPSSAPSSTEGPTTNATSVSPTKRVRQRQRALICLQQLRWTRLFIDGDVILPADVEEHMKRQTTNVDEDNKNAGSTSPQGNERVMNETQAPDSAVALTSPPQDPVGGNVTSVSKTVSSEPQPDMGKNGGTLTFPPTSPNGVSPVERMLDEALYTIPETGLKTSVRPVVTNLKAIIEGYNMSHTTTDAFERQYYLHLRNELPEGVSEVSSASPTLSTASEWTSQQWSEYDHLSWRVSDTEACGAFTELLPSSQSAPTSEPANSPVSSSSSSTPKTSSRIATRIYSVSTGWSREKDKAVVDGDLMSFNPDVNGNVMPAATSSISGQRQGDTAAAAPTAEIIPTYMSSASALQVYLFDTVRCDETENLAPTLRGDECVLCSEGQFSYRDNCLPCDIQDDAEGRTYYCFTTMEEVREYFAAAQASPFCPSTTTTTPRAAAAFWSLTALLFGVGYLLYRSYRKRKKLSRILSEEHIFLDIAEATASMDPSRVAFLTEVEAPNELQVALLDVAMLLERYTQFMPYWLRFATAQHCATMGPYCNNGNGDDAENDDLRFFSTSPLPPPPNGTLSHEHQLEMSPHQGTEMHSGSNSLLPPLPPTSSNGNSPAVVAAGSLHNSSSLRPPRVVTAGTPPSVHTGSSREGDDGMPPPISIEYSMAQQQQQSTRSNDLMQTHGGRANNMRHRRGSYLFDDTATNRTTRSNYSVYRNASYNGSQNGSGSKLPPKPTDAKNSSDNGGLTDSQAGGSHTSKNQRSFTTFDAKQHWRNVLAPLRRLTIQNVAILHVEHVTQQMFGFTSIPKAQQHSASGSTHGGSVSFFDNPHSRDAVEVLLARYEKASTLFTEAVHHIALAYGGCVESFVGDRATISFNGLLPRVAPEIAAMEAGFDLVYNRIPRCEKIALVGSCACGPAAVGLVGRASGRESIALGTVSNTAQSLLHCGMACGSSLVVLQRDVVRAARQLIIGNLSATMDTTTAAGVLHNNRAGLAAAPGTVFGVGGAPAGNDALRNSFPLQQPGGSAGPGGAVPNQPMLNPDEMEEGPAILDFDLGFDDTAGGGRRSAALTAFQQHAASAFEHLEEVIPGSIFRLLGTSSSAVDAIMADQQGGGGNTGRGGAGSTQVCEILSADVLHQQLTTRVGRVKRRAALELHEESVARFGGTNPNTAANSAVETTYVSPKVKLNKIFRSPTATTRQRDNQPETSLDGEAEANSMGGSLFSRSADDDMASGPQSQPLMLLGSNPHLQYQQQQHSQSSYLHQQGTATVLMDRRDSTIASQPRGQETVYPGARLNSGGSGGAAGTGVGINPGGTYSVQRIRSSYALYNRYYERAHEGLLTRDEADTVAKDELLGYDGAGICTMHPRHVRQIHEIFHSLDIPLLK